MEAKDITEYWVKANFDIDKERKKLHKKSNDYSCGQFSYDYIPVDEFIKHLHENIKRYRDYVKAPKEAIPFIDVGVKYDKYDGASLKMDVIFKWTVFETDEQVIKRIIRSEKIKISAINNKAKAKAAKEEKDRKEYERLKKKYT